MVRLQGELVPLQGVGEPVHVANDQPANVDPAPALAESFPVPLLGANERVHVNGELEGFETVCDERPVVEPPHLKTSGAFWTPTLNPGSAVTLIEPVPVPANVMVRFSAAATYGPTKGPPVPTGATPAG
jgi:hypothetical protein